MVTDKLGSYGVAHRELLPGSIHDTSQYANSRAEVSHQPTRVRERGMRRFKSTHQLMAAYSTGRRINLTPFPDTLTACPSTRPAA